MPVNIKKFRVQLGLTLIELVIVTSIILILGSFAFANYSEHRLRLQQEVGREFGNTIIMQQAEHYLENQKYATLSELGYTNTNPISSPGFYRATLQDCSDPPGNVDDHALMNCVSVFLEPTGLGVFNDMTHIVSTSGN